MNDLVKYSDFLEKRDKLQRPAPEIPEEDMFFSSSSVISFEEMAKIFLDVFAKGCPMDWDKGGRMTFTSDSWGRETFNIEMKCSHCFRKAKAAVIKSQVYGISKEDAKKNLKEFAQFIFENFGDICEIEGKRREIE